MENYLNLLNQYKKSFEENYQRNPRVVFTNGCFDLLHPGHVKYLEKAKKLGDILVVAIDSDDSVKKLKGKEPLFDLNSRKLMLSSLRFVDLVIPFSNQKELLELINTIAPDIIVKGHPYQASITDPQDPLYVVGSDIVRKQGGSVVTIEREDEYSSSLIKMKIAKDKF